MAAIRQPAKNISAGRLYLSMISSVSGLCVNTREGTGFLSRVRAAPRDPVSDRSGTLLHGGDHIKRTG